MTPETRAADDPASEAAIDVTDGAAVERWTRALGVTDEALLHAVERVGTRVDKVKDFLAGGRAAEQSDG